METYYCNDGGESDDQTCSINESSARNERSVPDFIVCSANDLQKMESRLAMMSMQEIGRFVQGIDGIKLSDHSQTPGSGSIAGFISLIYEEVVLLQRL